MSVCEVKKPKVCCADHQDCKFCPECGNYIVSPPLVDLLKYCIARAKEEKRCVDRIEQWCKEQKRNPNELSRWVKHSERLSKWRSWHDELKALLKDKP
jgi:hypothetical protein